MKLPDTCVWVEYVVDSAIGRRYGELFADPVYLLAPTLVQYELRRRALCEPEEDAADRIIAATRNARVVPLDETTVLHTAARRGFVLRPARPLPERPPTS